MNLNNRVIKVDFGELEVNVRKERNLGGNLIALYTL
jgi:hypothetical protein